jgi:toxin ParE1/3/4
VKRLDLTEIARTDLASIRRYSSRKWGRDQTIRYMDALRGTMKGLVYGRTVTRERDDLRSGMQMATSGRHCIFFETDESRILVVRVLHDRMDYHRHLGSAEESSRKGDIS